MSASMLAMPRSASRAICRRSAASRATGLNNQALRPQAVCANVTAASRAPAALGACWRACRFAGQPLEQISRTAILLHSDLVCHTSVLCRRTRNDGRCWIRALEVFAAEKLLQLLPELDIVAGQLCQQCFV